MKQVFPLSIENGPSQSRSYILMLGEAGTGTRLPIFIGAHEAQGVLLAQEHVDTRRPLTHRLMSTIMEEFALTLQQVTIDRMCEGIFYATLHISDGFSVKQFDCRASDAITLALHKGCPILVAEQVMEEAGVIVDSVADVEPSLEELEEELRRCEEDEEYERAAEIQQKIEQIRQQ